MQALLSAVWGVGLLLALNGARVVSARHNSHAPQSMFVFGDSFVDSGNIPCNDPGVEMSRQWYYPYGLSYQEDDGSGAQANPTGRLSDYMVQSDFIAKMLRLPLLSPPTYQSTQGHFCDTSGMNFAFAGTGANRVSFWNNLRNQVDDFKKMVKRGIISKKQVTHSIALVAVSGNDYKKFGIRRNYREIADFAVNTTTEIVANVARLRNLGVKRILVNNLHPLGCTPSQTWRNSYDACDKGANNAALVHNTNLERKLGTMKDVLIVDLHNAFDNIIGHVEKGHGTAESLKFKHRRKPCCIPNDPKGFCGQLDENSEPLYSLCENPSKFFFWDEMHPTHAGWEAVFTQLEDPIKEFIGLV